MQITSRFESFGNKIYGVSLDFSSGKIMFKVKFVFGANELETTAEN
jgi:hypothetical protein